MRIENDKLVFDDADILTFTPATQKALAFYTGPNIPPETVLLTAFNSTVDQAIEAYKKSGVVALGTLAAALLVADPAKQAQAQALIDQAKVVLGVQAAKVEVEALKAEKV